MVAQSKEESDLVLGGDMYAADAPRSDRRALAADRSGVGRARQPRPGAPTSSGELSLWMAVSWSLRAGVINPGSLRANLRPPFLFFSFHTIVFRGGALACTWVFYRREEEVGKNGMLVK